MASNSMNIPGDIVHCIVEFLPSRKDVYRCTLVNHTFHDASIPLLYRTIDIRMPLVRRRGDQVHVLNPFDTIAQKPDYAQYVQQILHCARHCSIERLATLRLCHNLRSFSWTDSTSLGDADTVFGAYLDILQEIHIAELHVKISSGISERMLARLMQFRGLSSLGLTSSHLPRADLDAWGARVGPRLTALDFSISSEAGRRPQFLRHMTNLRSLRLDAPTSSIPAALSSLPHLTTLDVRYHAFVPTAAPPALPLARLQHLVVHVIQGVAGLWDWIAILAPYSCTLRNLTIHNRAPQGDGAVPLGSVRWLAQLHGGSLRQLFLYNLTVDSNGERVLFTAFRELRALSFMQQVHDLRTISDSVHFSRTLKTLMVQYPRGLLSNDSSGLNRIAERWMNRNGGSALTSVSFGPDILKGKWVYSEQRHQPVFEIHRDVDARSRWM